MRLPVSHVELEFILILSSSFLMASKDDDDYVVGITIIVDGGVTLKAVTLET